MADIAGTITLGDLVQRTMVKASLEDDDYLRIYQIAVDAYSDINRHHYNNSVTIKTTLGTLNEIDYPSDYESLISIGIAIDGRLWTFTKSKTIIVPIDDNDDDVEDPIPAVYYGTYGTRGGINEYYYIDEPRESRIYVNGVPTTDIYLTYQTRGIESEDTLIPVYAYPLLESQILMELALYNDNEYTQAQITRRELKYAAELIKFRNYQLPTLGELADKFLEMYSQSYKR